MGIWAGIQTAWNTPGKLMALLRLARELRKDLAAHVLADRAPGGLLGADLPRLPESERAVLEGAARALAALRPALTAAEHLVRGNAFYAAERFDEALEQYDAALTLRPDDPDSLNNRARTLYHLQRYEEAVVDFNRSLELRPDDRRTLNNRGVTLRRLMRSEDALVDYSRSLELRPDNPLTLSNRAAALTFLKRWEAALADADRALERQPDRPQALANRAIALAHLGRHEEALADFKRTLELRADDPNTTYNIACLYSLQGLYDESLQWLEQAISADPQNRALAREDEDFAALRADPEFGPRFQKLMEEGNS